MMALLMGKECSSEKAYMLGREKVSGILDYFRKHKCVRG